VEADCQWAAFNTYSVRSHTLKSPMDMMSDTTGYRLEGQVNLLTARNKVLTLDRTAASWHARSAV